VAVRLTLEANAPQRRVTVAFRIFAAIPHLIVMLILQQVAIIAIFFAWFACLFTGRMPSGMGDFLTKVLQYQTRVYAYLYLLTDRYPSFEIGRSGYAVELEVDEPEPLNRAAVFFRFFLQLPAFVLMQLVQTGAGVIAFFVWLITLVAGRNPTASWLAYASMLRFQMRTWAYSGMLTSEYPGGLFGDRDDDVIERAVENEYVEDDQPVDALPPSPRITHLVLHRAAKNVIVLSLLLGIGWSVLNVATTVVAIANIDFDSTFELDQEWRDLELAFDTWDDLTRDCAPATTPDCQRTANSGLRSALFDFERAVVEVQEGSAFDEAVVVLGDVRELYRLLGQMTESADPRDQLRLTLVIQDVKRELDDHYLDLYDASLFR